MIISDIEKGDLRWIPPGSDPNFLFQVHHRYQSSDYAKDSPLHESLPDIHNRIIKVQKYIQQTIGYPDKMPFQLRSFTWDPRDRARRITQQYILVNNNHSEPQKILCDVYAVLRGPADNPESRLLLHFNDYQQDYFLYGTVYQVLWALAYSANPLLDLEQTPPFPIAQEVGLRLIFGSIYPEFIKWYDD